jgi:hypothetical protein
MVSGARSVALLEAQAFMSAFEHERAIVAECRAVYRTDDLYLTALSDGASADWYKQRGLHLYRVFDLSTSLKNDVRLGAIDLRLRNWDSADGKESLN